MRIKQVRCAVIQGKRLTREEPDNIDMRSGHTHAEMQYGRLYSDAIFFATDILTARIYLAPGCADGGVPDGAFRMNVFPVGRITAF